jgi:hypothetical protein
MPPCTAAFEHEHDDEHLVADFGVSSVERYAALGEIQAKYRPNNARRFDPIGR